MAGTKGQFLVCARGRCREGESLSQVLEGKHHAGFSSSCSRKGTEAVDQ